MSWDDVDDLRPRFRLCRVGFSLSALALGLLCLDAACFLASQFGGVRDLAQVVRHPAWDWVVGAPITWGSLLGSYLLWGRWPDPAWQRRAGCLVLMNTIDLAFWLLDHGDSLGLHAGGMRHEWLRFLFSRGLGFAELLLFAGLAAELAARMGHEEARQAARGAKTLAVAGLVILSVMLVHSTHWRRGWPLVWRARMETLMLVMGSSFLLALAAFQVTVLCALVVRQCTKHLQDLDRNDPSRQLLEPYSQWPDDESGE